MNIGNASVKFTDNTGKIGDIIIDCIRASEGEAVTSYLTIGQLKITSTDLEKFLGMAEDMIEYVEQGELTEYELNWRGIIKLEYRGEDINVSIAGFNFNYMKFMVYSVEADHAINDIIDAS